MLSGGLEAATPAQAVRSSRWPCHLSFALLAAALSSAAGASEQCAPSGSPVPRPSAAAEAMTEIAVAAHTQSTSLAQQRIDVWRKAVLAAVAAEDAQGAQAPTGSMEEEAEAAAPRAAAGVTATAAALPAAGSAHAAALTEMPLLASAEAARAERPPALAAAAAPVAALVAAEQVAAAQLKAQEASPALVAAAAAHTEAPPIEAPSLLGQLEAQLEVAALAWRMPKIRGTGSSAVDSVMLTVVVLGVFLLLVVIWNGWSNAVHTESLQRGNQRRAPQQQQQREAAARREASPKAATKEPPPPPPGGSGAPRTALPQGVAAGTSATGAFATPRPSFDDSPSLFLCRELLVPQGQECALLVPKLPVKGYRMGQVTVEDLRGLSVFVAKYAETDTVLILSSASPEHFVFGYCRQAAGHRLGTPPSLWMYTSDDRQFGQIAADTNEVGADYTMTTPRGRWMKFKSDSRPGYLNAMDDQGRMLAIAEPEQRGSRRIRIGPSTDAGLIAVCMMAIDLCERHALEIKPAAQ